MQQLTEDLYSLKPDVIIIISPHGEVQANKITINQSPILKANFNQFGDLITSLKWRGDPGMAYKIYMHFESNEPMNLIQEEQLDHGVSVPLYYLAQNLKNVKIVPLNYSAQDHQTHFEFGKKLQEIIQESNQRVAVIASGDLSHSLTADAPAGYSSQGKKFDKKIVDSIKKKKYQDIIKMDEKLVNQAAECGMRSICILLGVIDGIDLNSKVLSYEGPFGVGYLVAEFV